MKTRLWAIPNTILLAGCSTIFTNAHEIDSGIYQITAHGNVFNSNEAMYAKALKKAEKKCGHLKFKKIGDTTTGTNEFYNTTIGTQTYSPNITITVDCNTEE